MWLVVVEMVQGGGKRGKGAAYDRLWGGAGDGKGDWEREASEESVGIETKGQNCSQVSNEQA